MNISFEFNLIVALVIILSTISQAVFGVGILLWGTPLLLFLGKDFIDVLTILLPLSLMVSVFQFAPNLHKINKQLIKNFIMYSIPGLVFGLVSVIFFQLDLRLLVAIVLISSVIINKETVSQKFLKLIEEHDKKLMAIIGLIHGISNLGGSLLVFRISFEAFEKIKFRSNVALTYFIFALSQIVTLSAVNNYLDLYPLYFLLCMLMYFAANQFVFLNIDQSKFSTIITSFMVFLSVALTLSYFLI